MKILDGVMVVPEILIVCHAGPGIGLGHLMRSLVAARALKAQLGANVQLLVQGKLDDSALLSEFPARLLPSDADLCSAMQAECFARSIDVLVLDLFAQQIPVDLLPTLTKLRSLGCKLVALDGLTAFSAVLDLIFFPSFRCPAGLNIAHDTRVVYGWDCFLVNVPDVVPAWSNGRRVLVLTGGSDVTGLGNFWLGFLNERLDADVELDWVTGPYAKEPVWPDSPRITMLNHHAPKGLETLMSGANYAVTVFGVSFFELIYFGIPTVVFSPYGEKDSAELAALAAADVALVVRDEYEATEALIDLMSNPQKAEALSKRARAMMPVHGGVRLSEAIRKILINK